MIVDEAYIEFGGESVARADHPNVAVAHVLEGVRLGGARIGYVLTSPEVVGDLQRCAAVPHVFDHAGRGIVALRHTTRPCRCSTRSASSAIASCAQLGAMPGVTVFPSDELRAVRAACPSDAKRVWQALLDRGVLVRDLTAVVPNALRVTAGAEHEVDLFLAALRRCSSDEPQGERRLEPRRRPTSPSS